MLTLYIFAHTHNIIVTFCTSAKTCAVLDLPHKHFRCFTLCPLMERHDLPVTLSLAGGGEEGVEETVTISAVYFEPNAAEPTQDSTKDFTPRVETATVREKARDSTPRKPLRTEVRSTPDIDILGNTLICSLAESWMRRSTPCVEAGSRRLLA